MVDRIILGPCSNSPLIRRSAERMCDLAEMPKLKDRLRFSSIPFRSLP